MRSIENCNKQLIYAMSNVQLCQVFCPVHELVKSLPVSIRVYKSLSESIRTICPRLLELVRAYTALSYPVCAFFEPVWALRDYMSHFEHIFEPVWANVSLVYDSFLLHKNPLRSIERHQTSSKWWLVLFHQVAPMG